MGRPPYTDFIQHAAFSAAGIAVVFALPISLRLLGLLNIHGTALITFLATFAFFSCIMISTGAIWFWRDRALALGSPVRCRCGCLCARCS